MALNQEFQQLMGISEFQMRKQPTTHMEEIGRVCSLKLASMTPFSE